MKAIVIAFLVSASSQIEITKSGVAELQHHQLALD
jgi:hypothetical protein